MTIMKDYQLGLNLERDYFALCVPALGVGAGSASSVIALWYAHEFIKLPTKHMSA